MFLPSRSKLHQRRPLAADAAGNVAAGAARAGITVKGGKLTAPETGGDLLVLGDYAEQGKPCGVDRVVDCRVQGFEQLAPHAVDHQMQLALRKAVQLHDRSLGVAKARRFGRRHDDHAVGAARRQTERATETGRRVDQAAVVLLADRPEQRGNHAPEYPRRTAAPEP